jgi:hypothetical protein
VLEAANTPPTVTITTPANGTSLIGPVAILLEASASATSAGATIASVTYYKGSTKLATETVSPYQYNWKNVAAGIYSITAVAKDSLGLTATSAAVSITVTQDQPPVVSMSAPANGAILTGPATIPLTATASSPDETIASVTFYQGATKLGTCKAAPYQYTWRKVAAGTYTLTAVATDSLGVSTTSAPISITVNQDQPPVVSLTSPANGFTTIGPATIPLTATAYSTDEAIASVAFYQGATKLGTSKTVPYQFTWKNVAAGSYSLTAVATDTLGISTTSAPVAITVTPDQPPVVSITAPVNGYSITGPTTIVLTASASSPDEAIKSVAFYQGATKIGTVTKSPYQYSWKSVPVGTYTLTAVATDILGVTTTSNPISITVTQDQAPSVQIITPISGATYVAPASIGLSAAATSPDVSIASVTYYKGATKLATEKTAPYLYSWNSVAAGSYSLTAVATDSVGGATTSTPVTVNVTATKTSSVKLTAPANGTVVAAPGTVALTATASAPAGVANVGFYAGNTLLGTSTSSPYQYNWLNAPAGLYYLTAVETDKLGAAVTSAPVSIRLDAPPVVLLTTPSSGSIFYAPASINIAASAVTTGTITKVEFFQNATLLGSSTSAPYQFSWTAVPVGTYSLTAEAFDSYGISAFSPAVGVQVVTEQPPVITLSTPTSGLTFGTTANVSLSFNATASPSIAKVEIYRNGTLVATLTSPSAGGAWTFTEPNPLPVGKYTYFARAYDSLGTSTDSAPAMVIVAPNLPYLTDFEAADGFALGTLDSQVGWAVTQGSANVTNTAAYSGSQSVQLVGGTPVAIAQQVIASSPNETIIFCDFYAEPSAETSITSSTIFTAEQAQFGFQQSNGQGVLQVFRGNGSGGGAWVPTSFTIPLTGNQAQAWVHLTARLDFTKQTWDIYANGNMIAYDIPFISNTSTYFSVFEAQGDASSDSFFDDIYIGPDNPLFTDGNDDGIDDAWETKYGLSLAVNDRYLNLSGDGIPIIQDYINGTSPLIDTLVTPPPVQSGLILDLRADAGVIADSSGNVSGWMDQSPAGNSAFMLNPANEPQLAANQINGLPALSFNGQNNLGLPYNMMQNAQAGEIIGVVKVGNEPDNFSMLWNFGTGYGTSYYGTLHYDDFGTSDTTAVQVETEAQINQYYIYDTSIDSTGTSIFRYNGVPLWTRTGLPVGFQPYPDLGGYGNGSLIGDIAEVMVYNRILTDQERFSIGQYLTGKYAFPSFVVPTAPTDLKAVAISSDTVDLSWTLQNPGTMHTVTTVERQTGSGAVVQVAQVNDAWGYTDTGLTPGTSYTYQITVQSYLGTSGPSNLASATTPSNVPDPPPEGLSLWLRSTVGTEGTGPVSLWVDQSGLGNNANQNSSTNQPQLIQGQANGLPVVRFNGSNELVLPQNMLQSAQSGEIIALVRVGSNPNNFSMLWNFGTGFGTSYYNTLHFDDFGTSDTGAVVVETQDQISQYYVYDTSIDTNGNAIYRFNGTPLWTRTGLTVGFQQYPDIGGYGGGNFVGDIAEIIVYDRVLSSQEQATVYSYLAAKYSLPSVTATVASPAITSGEFASGNTGQAFNFQVTAGNNPTSFSASGLPPGISMSSTGLISGTPTIGGSWNATVTATNASGSGSSPLFFTITAVAPVITSATSAAGQIGQSFSYQIVAIGATTYSATGLPPGLNVDPIAGLISGTPTIVGTSTVNLTATNATGSGTATLTITVAGAAVPAPVITSGTTATGFVGSAFSYQITASNSPTGFAATGLPAGLTVDPIAGLISGTPTASGSYTVNLTASNGTGSGSTTLTITISSASSAPVPAGLILWLEGDAGIQTESLNGVTTAVWKDQSGQGNDATQSAIAQTPTSALAVLNGHAVVHFTSSQQQYLELPALLSSATEGDLFVVLQSTDSAQLPASASEWGAWALGQNGTGFTNASVVDDFLSSTQHNIGPTPVSLNKSFNLYNSTASGTQWSAQLNGSVIFTSSTNTVAMPPSADVSSGIYGTALGVGYFLPAPPQDYAVPPTKIHTQVIVEPSGQAQAKQLGSAAAIQASNSPGRPIAVRNITSGFAASFFDGDIAEVILYNRVLSAQERLEVGYYLQNKYDLPNMPAPAAPAAPTGLLVNNLTSTSFTLNWTASTGGVPITGYEVYVNGTLIATVSGTSYNITGLTTGTSYSVTVMAVDSLGRLSTGSSPLIDIPMAAWPWADDPYGYANGDPFPNYEDAQPGNPAAGILTVTIISPANGSTVP